MRTLCLACPEEEKRLDETIAHFKHRGVQAEFFPGIHARAFGLFTTHHYLIDDPRSSGSIMAQSRVGCFLSHYAMWLACSLLPEDRFLILENDAEFPVDWASPLDKALNDTPADADMLFIGSCNTSDKPDTPIAGTVHHVEWPMCTHAYIVWKKALPILISTQRDCWAPVDIAMIFRTFPKLKVYTVIPRIVGQRNMDLMP